MWVPGLLSLMASKPVIKYFPIRGRAEAIRLALRVAGVEYVDENVADLNLMKTDLGAFPFGQCPRYEDEDVDIVQSNAIIRHVGRKHNLYGSGLKEAADIDMIIDGVEDFRKLYVNLIYVEKLAEDAKTEYWRAHFDPSTCKDQRGGAHMLYFSQLLKRYPGKYMVGDSISIADIVLFDLLELHIRIYKQHLKAMYPDLTAYFDGLAEEPGMKDHLADPNRFQQVNGISLG